MYIAAGMSSNNPTHNYRSRLMEKDVYCCRYVLKHPDSQLQVTANGEGCILLQVCPQTSRLTTTGHGQWRRMYIAAGMSSNTPTHNYRSRLTKKDVNYCRYVLKQPDSQLQVTANGEGCILLQVCPQTPRLTTTGHG